MSAITGTKEHTRRPSLERSRPVRLLCREHHTHTSSTYHTSTLDPVVTYVRRAAIVSFARQKQRVSCTACDNSINPPDVERARTITIFQGHVRYRVLRRLATALLSKSPKDPHNHKNPLINESVQFNKSRNSNFCIFRSDHARECHGLTLRNRRTTRLKIQKVQWGRFRFKNSQQRMNGI